MQKKFRNLLLILAIVSICGTALAQLQFGATQNKNKGNIIISSFPDYYPLGDTSMDMFHYNGVFDDFIKELTTYTKSEEKIYYADNYQTTVERGSKGASELLFGMYSDSSLYQDWKFIYPAAIDNPVHLVTLPSRIHEIKSLNDLKSMKGAIHAKEYWNEFVLDQFSKFNLETVDNSYDLYGKLIRGEIDYIFTTYWFGMTEVMKLGLNDFVSFSQKSIWNMPIFIGVAKGAADRKFLVHYLTKKLEQQEVRDQIKNRAIQILEEVKEKTAGTVPPPYTLENKNM